jgi:hypothetical protein
MIDVLHGMPTAALGLGVMGLGIIGLVVLIAIVVALMLMPARWVNS